MDIPASVVSVSVLGMLFVPSLLPPASPNLSSARVNGWVTSTGTLLGIGFQITWPCFQSSRLGMMQGMLIVGLVQNLMEDYG